MSLQEQVNSILNKISRLEKEKERSAEVRKRTSVGDRQLGGLNFTEGNLNKQIAALQTRLQNLVNPPINDIEPIEIPEQVIEPMTEEKQQQNFTLGTLAIVGGAILLLS